MIIKNTIQRDAILKYLKQNKNHPTAQEVYDVIKKEMPHISLATVYRNLNLMAKDGLILKIEINKEQHFDGNACSHQHFICKKCGKIFDLFNEKITKYVIKQSKVKGFKIECANIMLSGYCKNCLTGG